MNKIEKVLEKSIPKLTGIYLFKNKDGTILYIGKTLNLHHRVNSYFQKYSSDWKIEQLINEYDDIDYILTATETEALLLEAKLIMQYQPKFNRLLKEGQPFLYILFSATAIELVRNKKKKGTYFGPFLQKGPARKTYNFLVQTFRLSLCNRKIEQGCLDYHIGNCAGNCRADFDYNDYLFRLNLAADVLKNNHDDYTKKIEDQMKKYIENLEFEKAQHTHDYLKNIDIIFNTIEIHFTDRKFATDIFVATTPTPYAPLVSETINTDLQKFLGVSNPIRTIDCFDISHFQSSYLVGSCVRFTDGKPDKHMFRRFKIKSLEQQNDYAALQEIVQRRYKNKDDLPDLILIDGGKGQLHAIQTILPNALVTSLAKKEEIFYSPQFSNGIHLDIKTNIGKLLIALRDYAHHFAISYHRLKRSKGLQK